MFFDTRPRSFFSCSEHGKEHFFCLEKMDKLLEVKPFNKFVDLKEFSKPESQERVVERWQTNLQYWSGNYLIVTGACFIFGFVIAPLSLAMLLIWALLLFLVWHTTKTSVLELPVQLHAPLRRQSLPKEKTALGIIAIGVISIAFFQGIYFWAAFLLALTFVTVHATFRQRTLGGKLDAQIHNLSAFVHNDSRPPEILSGMAEMAASLPEGVIQGQHGPSAADRERLQREREERQQRAAAIAQKWGIGEDRSAPSTTTGGSFQRRNPY